MPKNKRPPDLDERTLCMGLKKNLLDHSLLPFIDELVDNVSRRTHRASLLANHFILKNIEREDFDELAKGFTDQMFFYTSLSLGSSNKYPHVIKFFEENESKYETITFLPGTTAAFNSAARQMVTNVSNYLWMTFNQRINRLCSKYDKRGRKVVISRIRNRAQPFQLALQENESKLLDRYERMLSTTDPITDNWIINNPGPVIRMYRDILHVCEEKGLKGFSMLPIFQMKSHFVTIDAAILRHLLVKAGRVRRELSQKEFNEMKEEHFRSVFKVRGTCVLGNEVKTDGVSLRINVWRKTDSFEPSNKRKKMTAKEREEHEEEILNRDLSLLLPGDEYDYFSNDPGHYNQAFVHHTINNKVVKKARLTYKQFCLESHHSKNLKKTGKRLKEIQEETTLLSKNPVRTSSLKTFEAHLESKVPLYEKLWRHGLHPRMAKSRWDYKIHSSSCIDRFWSGLAYNHPSGVPLHQRPLLKYGSASWGWGGAPNKRMLRSAKKFFRVVEVSEFRTTVCCAHCGERLSQVTKTLIGPLKENQRHRPFKTIRGLKYCSSNACRSIKLKSRDGNAATNIGYAFPVRPEYLCRP